MHGINRFKKGIFYKIHVRKSSLISALWNAFGFRFMIVSVWKILWVSFAWVGMYFFLKLLVAHQETFTNIQTGYLLALGLFLTCFLGSLCFHQLNIQATRIGIQVCFHFLIKVPWRIDGFDLSKIFKAFICKRRCRRRCEFNFK